MICADWMRAKGDIESLGRVPESPSRPTAIRRASAEDPRDTRLLETLTRVCHAADVPPPHLLIVEWSVPRALTIYAMSDWFIYVGFGLATVSETTMDGVIAHEVAHIRMRHSETNAGLARVVRSVDPLRALYAVSGLDLSVLCGLYRLQEFEADREAVRYLGRMGHKYPQLSLIHAIKDVCKTFESEGQGTRLERVLVAERIKRLGVTMR